MKFGLRRAQKARAAGDARQPFSRVRLRGLGRGVRGGIAWVAGSLTGRSSARIARRGRILIVLILVLGVLIAAGGYKSIQSFADRQLVKELARSATEISTVLTGAIDRHLKVAEAARALFSGPDAKVSRWAFFEFARKNASDHPGLRALEWIPQVKPSDREELVKRARSDGLFDFRFVNDPPGGQRATAPPREEHYPVFFVEPYQGNEPMLGLDLAGDRVAMRQLARARDQGEMVADRAARLPIEQAPIPGFSVVLPVYRANIVPFTREARRAALAGFVRATYQFDLLMAALRPGLGGPSWLKTYILDQGRNGASSVVYHHSPEDADATASTPRVEDVTRGPHATITHEVAGWRWAIVVKPAPSFFTRILGAAAPLFAAFSLLITALLVQHLVALRVATGRAEAANRAKSEFLAMMSHELRTPLNAVIGFAETMRKQIFGPLGNQRYCEYAADIEHSALHLLGLIDKILELSKIESGHFELDRRVTSLAAIWEGCLASFEREAAARDIALTCDFGRSDLWLRVDPDAFAQILGHLVSNAIKFTPARGRVAVRAEVDKAGRIAIEVADTGIGISRQDIDLILEPFRQADGSLSRKYEGVGIGLPLTRQLVELHGGRLSIESAPGKGTVVTAAFPGDVVVARGDRPADPATRDAPAAAASA